MPSLCLSASVLLALALPLDCYDVRMEGPAYTLAFDSTSKLLSIGGSLGRVEVVDVSKRQKLSQFSHERHEDIHCLAFLSEGSLLVGGDAKALSLWDWDKKKQVFDFASEYSVLSGVITKDQKTLIATSVNGQCRIWDLPGRKLKDKVFLEHVVGKIVLGPQEDWLAVAHLAKNSIEIWDLTKRTKTTTLTGHSKRARGMALSPDGTILATGSLDASIIFWDTKTFAQKKATRRRRRNRLATWPSHRTASISFPALDTARSASGMRRQCLWSVVSSRARRSYGAACSRPTESCSRHLRKMVSCACGRFRSCSQRSRRLENDRIVADWVAFWIFGAATAKCNPSLSRFPISDGLPRDIHLSELDARFALWVEEQPVVEVVTRAVYLIIQHFRAGRP